MSKKDRKLTKKELQRKSVFEELCKDMEAKGYQKKDFTISAIKINVLSIIIMLPFVILMAVLYGVVQAGGIGKQEISIFWFVILMIICTILHELIHGLVWGLYAKHGFRAINFGIIWSSLNPYCTCSEPLNKKQYMIGTIMPTLIIGFSLCGIAIIINNAILYVVAQLMILVGGGDFYIVWKLLFYRTRNKDIVCLDHPYEIGLCIFEK